MRVFIYGNGTMVIPVYITENSYVSRSVMGDCTAYIEFFSAAPVAVIPGCYCSLLGEFYFVREAVVPVRDKNRLRYQLTLYGTVHELEKALYLITDSTGESLTSEVEWNCTPEEFVDQLVVNMLRIQPTAGWEAGSVISADAKTISLSASNCLDALKAAAELWGTHWGVDGKTVYLNKIENESSLTLEVGKNKGLRDITASKASDSKVITRLYPFGSNINSPTGLPLTIPAVDQPGVNELIEGSETFDTIYPHFLLTVTGTPEYVPGQKVLLTNPTGFDIEDYLIAGQTPQITFLSGECNGLTFSFTQVEYDGQIAYRITPKTLPDGSGYVPFATGYNINIGDKFEIWNCTMPEYFIDEAEAQLLEAAEDYLAAHQRKVKLNLTPDEIYFRANEIELELNQRITVISDIVPQLYTPGIEVDVIGYKRRIIQNWKYDSLIVGDVVLKEDAAQSFGKVIEKIVLKTVQTGIDDKHYLHSQATASSEWFVTHNLSKRPSVIVADADGNEREGQIIYLSLNTLKIVFSTAVSGLAICN